MPRAGPGGLYPAPWGARCSLGPGLDLDLDPLPFVSAIRCHHPPPKDKSLSKEHMRLGRVVRCCCWLLGPYSTAISSHPQDTPRLGGRGRCGRVVPVPVPPLLLCTHPARVGARWHVPHPARRVITKKKQSAMFGQWHIFVCTFAARMQQRPSQRPPPFLHVRLRALWLGCGPVEKKKTASPIPTEGHVAVCMPAARKEAIWHLVAPGRQTKRGGHREGPLASDIGSFSHGRAVQTLGAQDFIARGNKRGALHSNFQQRSTTGPYGVSELSLAPHRATVLTTRRRPAGIAPTTSGGGVRCAPVSPALAVGLRTTPACSRCEQDH
jgi:hypothetical protein